MNYNTILLIFLYSTLFFTIITAGMSLHSTYIFPKKTYKSVTRVVTCITILLAILSLGLLIWANAAT